MEQGDLMDLIATSRDEAIDRVEEHANSEWKEVAYVTAIEVARTRRFFTSEDVWDALSGDASTHEPRAMGAVMRRLRKENVVEPTDQFITSTSPLGHGRPSRVWRSLLGGEQRTLENNDRQPDSDSSTSPAIGRLHQRDYYYDRQRLAGEWP